ncbi:HemK methyltransferase member 2, partial [Borealophlyctis nickersoniae]
LLDNFSLFKVPLDVIRTSFSHSLTPRLFSAVDVLLFNPPYVLTPSEEVGSSTIEAAWAGGIDGREVIDQALPIVNDLLSSSGVFYMVTIRENKPDEIMAYMAKMYGFKSKVRNAGGVESESREGGPINT